MSSMPTLRSREIKIVQEIPISKNLKFYQGLKEGKVYATKCKDCGKVYFPPMVDCPECLTTGLDWVELSSEAEIETFTHVVVRPTTFQQQKPYTVAIGRLKEGVRVLAWLNGFKLSEVKVGMKAKLVAGVTPEGNATYEFIKP
ncbi:MAG TPA: Zn-ribbon domain-containing OB-fold protein [Candidatus Bathyarchaeia archaeon]|nr:Zn-ribbon domain-containing OB-fold protein [Candidatus Bathyarchaeia archaeon]